MKGRLRTLILFCICVALCAGLLAACDKDSKKGETQRDFMSYTLADKVLGYVSGSGGNYCYGVYDYAGSGAIGIKNGCVGILNLIPGGGTAAGGVSAATDIPETTCTLFIFNGAPSAVAQAMAAGMAEVSGKSAVRLIENVMIFASSEEKLDEFAASTCAGGELPEAAVAEFARLLKKPAQNSGSIMIRNGLNSARTFEVSIKSDIGGNCSREDAGHYSPDAAVLAELKARLDAELAEGGHTDAGFARLENGVLCVSLQTRPGMRFASDGNGGLVLTGFYYAQPTTLNIPSVHEGKAVTAIGENAFADCDGLTGVTIPDSVVSIGNYAFARCLSLKSVIIPQSAAELGFAVFSGCEELAVYSESAAIPAGWDSDWDFGADTAFYLYSENAPASAGNYWRYVDSRPAVWPPAADPDNPVNPDNPDNPDVPDPETPALWKAPFDRAMSFVFAGTDRMASGGRLADFKSGEEGLPEGVGLVMVVTGGASNIGIAVFESAAQASAGAASIANYFNVTEGEPYTEIDGNQVYIASDKQRVDEYRSLTPITRPPAQLLAGAEKVMSEGFLNQKYKETLFMIENKFGAVAPEPGSATFSFKGFYTTGNLVRDVNIVTSADTAALVRQQEEFTARLAEGGYTPDSGATLTAGCLTIVAEATPGFRFEPAGADGYVLTDYIYGKPPTEVVIPASHNGKPVVKIRMVAFADCPMTSVVIPDGVIEIERGAFLRCTGLSSVIIPSSVSVMEYGVFEECPGMTLYCEAARQPDGWENGWNFDGRDGAATYWFSDTQPTQAGNFWHYVNGEAVVWPAPPTPETPPTTQQLLEKAVNYALDTPDTNISAEHFNDFSGLTDPGDAELLNNLSASVYISNETDEFIAFGIFGDEAQARAGKDAYIRRLHLQSAPYLIVRHNVIYLSSGQAFAEAYFAYEPGTPALSDKAMTFIYETLANHYANEAYQMSGFNIIPITSAATGQKTGSGFTLAAQPVGSNIVKNWLAAYSTDATFINQQIEEGEKELATGKYTDQSYIRQEGDYLYIEAHLKPGLVFALNADAASYRVEEFYYDSVNTTAIIPGEYKGLPVSTIPAYVFSQNSALKSVVIPASVTDIEAGAFAGCAAVSVFCEAASPGSGWAEGWNVSGDGLTVPVYWYSETRPAVAGNFWRYVDGNPEAWPPAAV